MANADNVINPLIIPIEPNVVRQTLETAIYGDQYTFDFHWNDRDGAWYFDLFEADSTPIVHGVKLVCHFPLMRRVHHQLTRLGAFIVLDGSGKFVDPGLADIGVATDGRRMRCQLVYLSVYHIVSQISFNNTRHVSV
jgi:hypothetical protein